MAKKKKNKDTIRFIISLRQFDLLIGTVLSFDNSITNDLLKKIFMITKNIDKRDYNDDFELSIRLWFLKQCLKTRLKYKLTDSNSIIDTVYSSSDKYEQEDLDCVVDEVFSFFNENESLYYEDILYIDELTSDIIQYNYILNYQDKIENYSMKLRNNDNDNIHELCEEYSNFIMDLNNAFKNSKATLSESVEQDFSSNDNTMERAVLKAHEQLNLSSNKLKSSIRMKNMMFDGGYESGRLYVVMGVQGGGKSVELLRIAMDMKHYNKDIKLENGKKPVILFVSQENSIKETIERIWSYYIGNNDDFKSHSENEVVDILKEHGFNEGPELIIKYRKSKSISTQDIETMIEKIEEDGDKKVVSVIHDYLKRIRSTQNNDNTYDELGAVSDEFANIAKAYNTSVITAMQFNREALKKIENALKSNQLDALKNIGNSDVSESFKIIDNADVIYAIFKQPHPQTGDLMNTYKLLKYRGKRPQSSPDMFSHPYEENNTIKLKPDLNLPQSLSTINIGDGLERFSAKNAREARNVKKNSPKSPVIGGRKITKDDSLLEFSDDDDLDEN